MKIFAAITDAVVFPIFYEKTGIKLNYLISYHYLGGQAYRLIVKYRHMIDLLYLDSGAYSVVTGRSKITITEYLRFLKLYGDRFDGYFNLDDDFDNPQHNQWNQQYLEEHLPPGAKRPIPVVHDNTDPFSEFELYAQMGHTFIAIGSTTKIPNTVFKKIESTYPNICIHIFGKLNPRMLIKHKPYSADNSTWAQAAGRGRQIFYWDPDEKKGHSIRTGSKDFERFECREKLEELLDNIFQLEYSDLLSKSGSKARRLVNLYYLKQLEDYINSI